MFPSSLVSTRDSETDDIVELTGVADGLTPLDECRILGLTYKNDGGKIHENTFSCVLQCIQGCESFKIVICDKKKKLSKSKTCSYTYTMLGNFSDNMTESQHNFLQKLAINLVLLFHCDIER